MIQIVPTCSHRTNSPVPVVCANCAHPHQRLLCRRCGIRMTHHTDRLVGYHLSCLQKRAPPDADIVRNHSGQPIRILPKRLP